MRRLTLLALGIALGALAVSGQDGGDPLAQEIERLRALLRERIAKRPQQGEQQIVRRTYDVDDLCTPIEDHPQPFEDLRPSTYEPPEPEPKRDSCGPFPIDELIGVIRATVEPGSWDGDGAEIDAGDGRIIVSTSPRVHRKIERVLKWCRAARDRSVSVEVAVVPVRDGFPAASELTAEEAQRLLEKPLGAVTLAGFEGRILGGRAGREISYLQDYDIAVAEDSIIGDPIRGTVFAGCTAQVRACLDGGGGAILHCRLELARVAEPIPPYPTPQGAIELPTKQLTRVFASFRAPLGRTVVAGGCTVGEEPCVILVTVRRR